MHKLSKSLLTMAASALLLGFTACSKMGEPIVDHLNIIPQAQSVNLYGGAFKIANLNTISAPDDWHSTVNLFIEDIKLLDISAKISEDAVLTLSLNESLAEEAYRLEVDGDEIEIEASTIKGASHALATLLQMMHSAIDGAIPNATIEDSPLYGYRGLMLDCSRHFWTVDEIKTTINQMSFFKLNTLHLHLTDNQGWRIAIDKYPNLVKAGTHFPDFPELSDKFYTTADLKEIVAHAAARGIEVIPEIDLPGHSTALLAAYPELSCNGGEFEVYPEERPWEKRKRANENMVCVGQELTYEFIENIIDALAEVFPSKYIHLGGDEVPTAIWEKCPRCQELFKSEGMKEQSELQDYFTRRLSKMAQAKGKVMIGWDEINDRGAATPADMLTVWRDEGSKAQRKALENGIPVIMCPQHGCYYDWGYAGNSTRKVYDWNPILADDYTPEQLALIKGGQGALWTERITTHDRVEWMLFPRLSALAEVLWTPAENRNWDNFYKRITAFYPIMTKMGINFYEDDALNEKDFVPSEEKPALVRNARIITNIPTNNPYHAEYAFDGRSNSFYWGGSTIGKEHFFTIELGEPMNVNSIEVITGDSKDYITKADLMVSEDGKEFTTVATFDDLGQSSATLGGKTIRAVKIQVTDQHSCWPIIKEVILK